MAIKCLAAIIVGVAVGLNPAWAQVAVPNPTQTKAPTQVTGESPVYRVAVVGRTAPAINYRHRSGSTQIDFRGTTLLPSARGKANVEPRTGYIEIEAKFAGLVPAEKYGSEYLTYVLWAITPEGRATNLGEVLLDGDDAELEVTTQLQAFGLIITAEPYSAVTQPSDAVVLENVVRSDTRGDIETIEARYELLKRGTYLMATDAASVPSKRPGKAPLDLAEARNAVYFARIAGADQYAASTFRKAADLLVSAEQENVKGNRKKVIGIARAAAQSAEDSRVIAVRRREMEVAAAERQSLIDREADAQRRAELEARQRVDAEAAQAAAESARLEADRASQRLARERAELEVRAAQLEQQRAAADARAEAARDAVVNAERLQGELREKLQQQLNAILETRETARGLILNMPDVLFDTGSATLKPGAREKLARVAGVLLAYPRLRIAVEGHTDNVGSDEYNQRLSDRRAESVRSYLTQQGLTETAIAARGFGESRPVVSNDSDAGRQQNRRVALVVSGEVIGMTDSSTSRP
jgi:outer membrane protein OmpA-like peptidoglycan-associated protein